MTIEEDLAALRIAKKTVHVPVCANCQKAANATCRSCHLVTYCGPECQKAHWAEHKKDCRSPLLKPDWEPSWVVQNRAPAFTGQEDALIAFGGKKYFWGNIPAYDVVKLETNEGAAYQGDLPLLFAASGDLRNILTTISSLPPSYQGALHMVINDLDFDVVARNIIILLIALTVVDDTAAINCMLHVWYSATIRPEHLDILSRSVRPLIQDVVQKVASKPEEALLGKTWKLGAHSIRVELLKTQWDALLQFFAVPSGLTSALANQARTAITLAPSRVDYRERHMLMLQPSHRMCFAKFREDGVLLPFGQSRDDFDVPNPTFYQSKTWPMKDEADPTDGWDLQEIISTKAGPATNDFYGKLSMLISQKLSTFRSKLTIQACNFRLTNMNAADLPKMLTGLTFARIEVSNISDGGYLGPQRTINCFGPMLQSPAENSRATLITLFMNATHEVSVADETAASGYTKRAMMYMPPPKQLRSTHDSQIIKMLMAHELVHDVDAEFAEYMKWQNFDFIQKSGRLEVKKKHSVIEKWPMRLKLQPGQSGAREEFELLLSSAHTGQERYVEWKVKQ